MTSRQFDSEMMEIRIGCRVSTLVCTHSTEKTCVEKRESLSKSQPKQRQAICLSKCFLCVNRYLVNFNIKASKKKIDIFNDVAD
jgi:hypothetical protein